MKQAKNQRNFLSIIVPSFRQEKTIKKDVLTMKNVMDSVNTPYEIIVVVDGEVDKTFKKAKEVKSPKIHVVGYKHNHGKGYAVRYGMSFAKGDTIAFIDAGMDLDPLSLQKMLLQMKKEKADIIIGSKLHPLSLVNYPWQRKILSWGYRTLVKVFFGLSVRDTQVGMKVFKRNVLEDVLPRLLVKAYAFDIEILAVAYSLNHRKIYEAPVILRFQGFSSITSKSFWRVVSSMLWDTFAVFYRLKILHYYSNKNKRKWKFDPELNFRINTP